MLSRHSICGAKNIYVYIHTHIFILNDIFFIMVCEAIGTAVIPGRSDKETHCWVREYGRAVAQMFRRRLSTAAARAECEVSGGQSAALGAGFSPSTSVSRSNLHSTNFSIIIITRGRHNCCWPQSCEDNTYLLTYVRSWALPEKLLIVQPFRNFPASFKEPEGSSPCSQEPSTGPYPEPVQSSPYHPIPSYLSKIHFNIVHSRR
jgi:hypothetical protein